MKYASVLLCVVLSGCESSRIRDLGYVEFANGRGGIQAIEVKSRDPSGVDVTQVQSYRMEPGEDAKLEHATAATGAGLFKSAIPSLVQGVSQVSAAAVRRPDETNINLQNQGGAVRANGGDGARVNAQGGNSQGGNSDATSHGSSASAEGGRGGIGGRGGDGGKGGEGGESNSESSAEGGKGGEGGNANSQSDARGGEGGTANSNSNAEGKGGNSWSQSESDSDARSNSKSDSQAESDSRSEANSDSNSNAESGSGSSSTIEVEIEVVEPRRHKDDY